ncbi:MAG: hypothetical protein ABJM39_06110 [Porticoccus sp.]|jgi:1,4-dihydroxy-2-naphthoate octaprenyltransferase|uniref:hypothetical protein n=1 Tax=Porticoccus sp. TaxID=2024853 RepID=UPI0032990AE7|tara:strand:- start:158 stop:388 length:231 start_codon:yes stop_codon:yes gene_type:complete
MKSNGDEFDEQEDKSRLIRYFIFLAISLLGVALFVFDNGKLLGALGLLCAAYGYYQMSKAMPLSYMIRSIKKIFFG